MKSLSIKRFIELYNPVPQVKDRTYKKYLIPNDYKVSTYLRMANTYSCNIFTGTIEEKIITLYPGRRFSLDNSFFIVTKNSWDSDTEDITIDLKKK